MAKKNSIAIIGGGSWATALVKVITENAAHIYWWVREPEIAENVKLFNRNPLYLSTIDIDPFKVEVETDIKKVIGSSKNIIFCYPAAFLNSALDGITKKDLKNKRIISAIKGLVPEYNLPISQYFNTVFKIPYQNLAIISGPSHAEEVASEKLTYLTIASENKDMLGLTFGFINNRYIETRISKDIKGIEYAAILKNIYAIGSGIAQGLGYGDNYQAVFMANAIKEIQVFLNFINGASRNIFSSPYLGDILVTGYSSFSRNKYFGTMLGKGYSLNHAQADMKMIAEGYYAINGIIEFIQKSKIEMPILEAIHEIVNKNKQANKVFVELKASFT